MSFEVSNLHVEQNSIEGQNLQALPVRDHVTPEEVILDRMFFFEILLMVT